MAGNTTLASWTCESCGKNFHVGDWTCADGINNHVVKEKVYRVCDAASDPGKPVDGGLMPIVRGRTVVCNIPPPKKVMVKGEVQMIGEGSVEFINGRYQTSDPEKQYWLDQLKGYNSTEDQWKANWLSDKELLAEKALELNALQQRLENDRNELLAKTKERVGGR